MSVTSASLTPSMILANSAADPYLKQALNLAKTPSPTKPCAKTECYSAYVSGEGKGVFEAGSGAHGCIHTYNERQSEIKRRHFVKSVRLTAM